MIHKVVVVAGLAVAVSAGPPAVAELWTGFYKSSSPAQPEIREIPQTATELPGESVCLSAILDAQIRYGIPDNLLLAIGLQEAGRRISGGLTVWPWSANAGGEGAFFKSRAEALAWVQEKQGQGGTNIDIGCMQINLRWHGGEFASLEEMYDPIANVDYSARFLTRLFNAEGDWWKAAGRYHSSTEKYQAIYLQSLEQNQRVVNANLAALANLATSGSEVEIEQVAEVVTDTTEQSNPSMFWTSASFNQDKPSESADYSIYSNLPLQPILPQFQGGT